MLDELEDKSNEIESLKIGLISQKEASMTKDLEETRRVNIDLKTQLEEARRTEEALKHPAG